MGATFGEHAERESDDQGPSQTLVASDEVADLGDLLAFDVHTECLGDARFERRQAVLFDGERDTDLAATSADDADEVLVLGVERKQQWHGTTARSAITNERLERLASFFPLFRERDAEGSPTESLERTQRTFGN